MAAAPPPPHAILLSYSDIPSDPRVRRQIDWLVGAGWTVDTIGLGDHPTDAVRNHYPILPPSRILRTRVGQALVYGILPSRSIFNVVMRSRIPGEALERMRSGEYDLTFFNEAEFLPLVGDSSASPRASAHRHLDMHEFRTPERHRGTLYAALTTRHYRWVRAFVGSDRFDSRSTVARGIAELYEAEFDIPPMTIVRNIPPYVEQTPSAVDPANIRLLYHGMAAWSRGLAEILEAMDGLDSRFTMTFMLTPPQHVIDEIRRRIEAAGLGERVFIVPPSPMRDLAVNINAYDLEIAFMPPRSPNIINALPNKVFEAVQGRLGIVTGRSAMIEDIVRAHGNGLIVEGWSGDDLRRALAALGADDVQAMKAASAAAASELSAEQEGLVFLAAMGIGADRSGGEAGPA